MMKNPHNEIRSVSLLALSLAVMLAAGCATMNPAGAKAPETTPAVAEEPAWEIEPWEGDGMDIPLDGSSMEAWQRSLARVQAHTSEAEFKTLNNAIEYLLVYDMAARGKLENLIERLDGLTGYDILAKVRWRAPRPGHSPAEKEADRASLIDT